MGGGSVLVPEQPAKIASTKATLETNCTLVLTLFSPVTFPCDYSDCAAHTRSASSSFHLMVPPAAHFCSEKSWQPDTMNCVISVIIPTLNEGRYLGATLQRLAQNAPQHEIIVSDGGSTDETVQIAGQYGPKVVASALTSPPVTGRALQMNSGARSATGEILLFLHADTHLRSTSLRQIEMALQNPAAVGGGFARRFDSESPFLRFSCWLATWRCRKWGWFLGDQAIFVRRTVFDQLHGFKDMPVFEDLDFSRRLARAGKVVTISPGIVCSARRFHQRGPLLTTCRDFWLTCRYLNGSIPNMPEK